MDDKQLTELEDESNWDWDRAEPQPAVAGRRTVIAVPFDRDEIEPIARQADRLGITIIEYIRRCALKLSRER